MAEFGQGERVDRLKLTLLIPGNELSCLFCNRHSHYCLVANICVRFISDKELNCGVLIRCFQKKGLV